LIGTGAGSGVIYSHCIFIIALYYAITDQSCAGSGVQESTPEGVGVFQQESKQDQNWIFSIVTGAGAGAKVIFNHNVFEILMSIRILRDL